MPGARTWLTVAGRSAPARLAQTVTRWANEGRLDHRRTLGGHRRYDPELIDAARRGLTYRP